MPRKATGTTISRAGRLFARVPFGQDKIAVALHPGLDERTAPARTNLVAEVGGKLARIDCERDQARGVLASIAGADARALAGVLKVAEDVAAGRVKLARNRPMTLEEFAQRHLDQRDNLALRELRGETLSPLESEQLRELNKTLNDLMPKPAPLPAEVGDAMMKACRLLGM